MKSTVKPIKALACVTVALIALVCLLPVGHHVQAQGGPPNFESCETQAWNSFWSANDTYTSALSSWYFQTPVSCDAECRQNCSGYTEGSDDWNQCMNSCTSNCMQTRYNAFTAAEDGLANSGWGIATCNMDEDFCKAARAKRDQCTAAFVDPYNTQDQWYKDEQYFACQQASGIWRCE